MRSEISIFCFNEISHDIRRLVFTVVFIPAKEQGVHSFL